MSALRNAPETLLKQVALDLEDIYIYIYTARTKVGNKLVST